MDGACYPNPYSGDRGHSPRGSGLPHVISAVVSALGSAGVNKQPTTGKANSNRYPQVPRAAWFRVLDLEVSESFVWKTWESETSL